MNGFESWLLHRSNDWVARSPASFAGALDFTDRGLWLLMAAVLAGLWFVGEPGIIPTEKGKITRLDNRQRILLMLGAMGISSGLARLLQLTVFHARPLVDVGLKAPIDPQVWQTVSSRLEPQSGFPSYQMALILVLVTGMFYHHAGAGGLALLAGAYYGLLVVGLGFYWPIDILAGALLGVLITSLLFICQPCWRRLLRPIVLQFEYHQILAHLTGFLFLFDLSQKFATSSSLLRILYGFTLGG